jgi:hypothetical protein
MEKAPLSIVEVVEETLYWCAVSKSYQLKDAAQVLEVDPSTVYEKRRKYGIPKPPPGSVPPGPPLTREELMRAFFQKLAERLGLRPLPPA